MDGIYPFVSRDRHEDTNASALCITCLTTGALGVFFFYYSQVVGAFEVCYW
jgi:hypothetical protein